LLNRSTEEQNITGQKPSQSCSYVSFRNRPPDNEQQQQPACTSVPEHSSWCWYGWTELEYGCIPRRL